MLAQMHEYKFLLYIHLFTCFVPLVAFGEHDRSDKESYNYSTPNSSTNANHNVLMHTLIREVEITSNTSEITMFSCTHLLGKSR